MALIFPTMLIRSHISSLIALALGINSWSYAQGQSWLRSFRTPDSVRNGDAFFASRVPNEEPTVTLLLVPIAPPEPDSTGTSGKYHQTFKILDSAAPISDQTISLYYPLDSGRKAAFQTDQHTVKEAILGPIGLRPGVPVVVLASSIKLNQISSLFAAAPLRVEHLKFKGKGDSPFYRTLLDYISSRPKVDTEELQWFLGNFLIRNTSIGSLAFAKRKQEYVELGQYAHALAQGKPDEIRVWTFSRGASALLKDLSHFLTMFFSWDPYLRTPLKNYVF